MVVSFDIYAVLRAVEIFMCFVYLPFLFLKRDEKWNKVLRLIFAIILMVINIVKIPMQVQLGEKYEWSILLLCIWLSNVWLIVFE